MDHSPIHNLRVVSHSISGLVSLVYQMIFSGYVFVCYYCVSVYVTFPSGPRTEGLTTIFLEVLV